MTTDLSCPVCGAELDLGVLFAHETDQRALARLAAVSIPLGARVMQYVALFTPPKTRLTAAALRPLRSATAKTATFNLSDAQNRARPRLIRSSAALAEKAPWF